MGETNIRGEVCKCSLNSLRWVNHLDVFQSHSLISKGEIHFVTVWTLVTQEGNFNLKASRGYEFLNLILASAEHGDHIIRASRICSDWVGSFKYWLENNLGCFIFFFTFYFKFEVVVSWSYHYQNSPTKNHPLDFSLSAWWWSVGFSKQKQPRNTCGLGVLPVLVMICTP